MAATQFRVEGLPELSRSLNRISKGLAKEIREINLKRAEPVAMRAKAIAPRKTGRLAGTIRPLASQRNARVAMGRASMVYPPVIYWGWPGHNIEPNHFIDRAISDLAAKTQKDFEKELDDFVREVWSQWR